MQAKDLSFSPRFDFSGLFPIKITEKTDKRIKYNRNEYFTETDYRLYHSINAILDDVDNLQTLTRFHTIQVMPLKSNAVKLRLTDRILDKREQIISKITTNDTIESN